MEPKLHLEFEIYNSVYFYWNQFLTDGLFNWRTRQIGDDPNWFQRVRQLICTLIYCVFRLSRLTSGQIRTDFLRKSCESASEASACPPKEGNN